jgi:DNA helicase HerA-like ATPase
LSTEIGKVLGTFDAEPLNFWIAVRADQLVQLDDVIMLRRKLPNDETVSVYGIVDQMVARHEGAKFESDVFLAEEGILPLTHAIKAHVTVTRVEPEIFVPPLPGQSVFRAEGADRDQALFFDAMKKRFPLGLSRDGEIIHGNFEFLDGTRGAHINISGVSGVATKTTYATFLLYVIFHSDLLGNEVINTKAIIFNVKGEDLLYLDKPNASLPPEAHKTYEKLGLPIGAFEDVAFYAPVQKGVDVLLPDTQTRKEKVIGYCWTIEDFCKGRYLRFLFADADDETSHLSALVERVEAELAHLQEMRTVDDFPELISIIKNSMSTWGHSFAPGTVASFIRRLEAATHRVGHLIRGNVAQPDRHRIDWSRAQVSVIDIHNLHDRAKRFVIGVVLKRMFEEKEATGSARPLVFVVLDELNKYAPREGSSPIKEVILDMAERGRSLGIILIGAQQTASQIERRVVGNSAYRVVGRLDLAEAQHNEYAFLPLVSRARAGILKPGTIIVSQPEIPIPLLAQFPFPAWATRPSEVAKAPGEDAFSALKKKKATT